jgi:prepilin-type N-terminal cleavage/methylation domain-containing protein
MRCSRCKPPFSAGSLIRSTTSRISRHDRAGFTLIEVVVGLVIMAGVMASSLLAFASHQRARRMAEARIAAVAVADEMLTSFSGSRGGIPPAARGPVPNRPGWWWQTSTVGVTAPAGIAMEVTRFQIIEIEAGGKANRLTHVDIVGAGT